MEQNEKIKACAGRLMDVAEALKMVLANVTIALEKDDEGNILFPKKLSSVESIGNAALTMEEVANDLQELSAAVPDGKDKILVSKEDADKYVNELTEALYKTGRVMDEMALQTHEKMDDMPWELHYLAESRQLISSVIENLK